MGAGAPSSPPIPILQLQALQAAFEKLPLADSSRPEVIGQSVCFGLSSLGGNSQTPVISSRTLASHREVAHCIAVLKSTQGFPHQLPFTSIQIGCNHETAEHRDKNNVGESWQVTTGDFTGGDLVVDGNPMGAIRRFIIFDGRLLHHVLPFLGLRWSAIGFVHSLHTSMCDTMRKSLLDLGFACPIDDSPDVEPPFVPGPLLAIPREIPAVQQWPVPHPAVEENSVHGKAQEEHRPRARGQPGEQNGITSEVCAKLVSARKITFRGCGQIPVVPFQAQLAGTWLVVDFFAGTGGLLYSLSACSA